MKNDAGSRDGLTSSRTMLLGAPDSTIDGSKAQWKFPQTMQIELARETVREMQRHVKLGKSIQLQFGKKPTLQYGTASKPLQISPAIFRTEVYSRNESSRDLDFQALISHVIAIEETVPQTDDALDKLKSSLQGLERDRANNRATFIDRPPSQQELARKSKAAQSALLARNRAALNRRAVTSGMSGALPSASKTSVSGSSNSLHAAPTSNPCLNSAQTAAARKPLIHLLAIRPLSTLEITRKTRIPAADLPALLQKVANRSSAIDEWTLVERYYKDLDVWAFKYQSQEDRQAAIDNAVKAYDRMRVSREDKLWQLLLTKEERGKGLVISNIKFRPVVSSNTNNNTLTISNTTANSVNASGKADSTSPKSSLVNKPIVSDHRTLLAGLDGGQPMVRTRSGDSSHGHVRKTSGMEKRLLSKKPGTPLNRPTSSSAPKKQKTNEPRVARNAQAEKPEKVEKPVKLDKGEQKAGKAEKLVKPTEAEKADKIDKPIKTEKSEKQPTKVEVSRKKAPVKEEKVKEEPVKEERPDYERRPAGKTIPRQLAGKAPRKSNVNQSSSSSSSISSLSSTTTTAHMSSDNDDMPLGRVNKKKRKAEEDLQSEERIKALKREYNEASSQYLQLRTELDQLEHIPPARLQEVWDKYNKYNKLAKRVSALEVGLASPIHGLEYNLSPKARKYLELRLDRISREYNNRRNAVKDKKWAEDEKEELHNMYDEIEGLKKICAAWA